MIDHALLSRQIIQSNGLPVTDDRLKRLGEYARLVLEWNTRINLVSRKDSENIWFGHIVHSLSPLFLVDIPPGCSLVDIGTGAGFPGIPLAIVRDDLDVVVVDSIKKKSTAVQEIVGELGLTNVRVVNSRAEDLPGQGFGGRFDVVTARAVSWLEDLIKWSLPLVRKPKGAQDGATGLRKFRLPYLLALKGGDLQVEIEAARLRSGRKEITTLDVLFKGIEKTELEEKKLVIVEL